MHKKLRSTLAAVNKTRISGYLAFLARNDSNRQKNSPFTKSIIEPSINDLVLIKDNSKDFRIGKIIELIKSDDGEIRQAILKTEHSERVYPITNLRFLEGHPKSNEKVDQQISPNVQCRPKRQSAEVAKARLGQLAN